MSLLCPLARAAKRTSRGWHPAVSEASRATSSRGGTDRVWAYSPAHSPPGWAAAAWARMVTARAVASGLSRVSSKGALPGAMAGPPSSRLHSHWAPAAPWGVTRTRKGVHRES